MKHKSLWYVIVALVLLALVAGCAPPVGPDPDNDGHPGADDDPIPPDSLPAVPDDGLPGPTGPGTFYAVLADQQSRTSLVSSDVTDPSNLSVIVDGDIHPEYRYLRFSPDADKVAYVNTSLQLVILDRSSGDSHLVDTYTEESGDKDEFWWFNNSVLLYSAGSAVSRAAVVDGGIELNTVISGHSCYHDVSVNFLSAIDGVATVALTFIVNSGGVPFATVYVGTYTDDGTIGELMIDTVLTTHEFDVGFDPMLTWLTEDVLVWRTVEDVSRVYYCNVPNYRTGSNPDAVGIVTVESEMYHPTSFLVSPDGTTVYLYGRGNSVTSVPVPAAPGDYNPETYYVDDIEFTVSKLAFSPSSRYFVVGNRSRLRCYDAVDPTIRYRWWEDTELEADLDAGELQILQVWLM